MEVVELADGRKVFAPISDDPVRGRRHAEEQEKTQ
jgi:hypothetical protein